MFPADNKTLCRVRLTLEIVMYSIVCLVACVVAMCFVMQYCYVEAHLQVSETCSYVHKVKKVKASSYIAQYPVLRTVQSALHFT